jgi:hypothetical protein
MTIRRTTTALALLVLLLSTACATPKQVFMHRWHRQDFAMTDEELKSVQFYISAQVLAQSLAPELRGKPEGIVIVPEETPGVVTEAGPDWLRVSFAKGGRGVPFVTVVTRSGDSAYWLATEVKGEEGFRRLRDLPEKILRVGDVEFQLVHGVNARLLIDGKDLDRLINTRTHIPGRPRGSN